MNLTPVEELVEAWGSLGASWGINRSMARIQAALLTSEEPLRLDQLAERLSVSRGNVSMSLRELRSWGVIRKVNIPGDRRDYFAPEPDMWTMFFRIGSERKRREFDPTIEALRAALADPEALEGETARGRLEQMESILATADRIVSVLLKDPESAKHVFTLLSGMLGSRRGKD
jgi:DNA-binding transcriptional regulator GbsR (MarR family)